ncbi:MAG TPA: carboxypeptidase-like regulatory domain-containing protein [Gemmatimonadaceae bacterium]|nr:carboxypeptidase-like regulatory domain-containing protein [Gemmatimonadaceae bacterium]
MPTRTVRGFAAALALTISGFVPALGQSVRGTVLDSASGQPIPGAVVWLADTAGGFLARGVSGSDGRYSVLDVAGSAQLHVLRIGFRPLTVAMVPTVSIAHGAARDTVIDVRLAAIALVLDPVASSRRRVCPGDKGTSDALQLWEQARAALLASVVARDADPPDLVLRSYTRSFEAMRRQLVEQVIRGRDVVADRSYVAARPAWALASDGYMREARSGDRTFYAPDEQVLLDPSFADTHCLHAVIGDGSHAGEVGIGFDPVSERGRDTLVDVSGTLWMDAGRFELRALDFQYTGLERDARGSGGEIAFETMPNGTAMITRWAIRTAVLAIDAPLTPMLAARRERDRRDRNDVRVVEWREEGGVVVSAAWPNGQRWRAPLRRISGTLVGELGRGLVGVRVWLANAPDTVISDSTGTYAFNGVLPGTYLVMAADSALAAVDLVQGRRAVDVRAGDHLEASILVVPPRMIVASRCRKQSMPPATGALLGRVVDAAGAAIADASIEAIWSQPANGAGEQAQPDRAVKSDDAGRFAICGVPMGASVRVHATSATPSSTLQAADARWTQRGVMTATLVLRGG